MTFLEVLCFEFTDLCSFGGNVVMKGVMFGRCDVVLLGVFVGAGLNS
jgi:hypothetical protein